MSRSATLARGGRARHTGAVTDVTSAPEGEREQNRFRRFCDAMAYAARREHVRSTVTIAFVVGVVLTLINQMDVIVGGDATATTWLKCGFNFLVPFVVANLGLMSGRDTTS